MHSTGTGCNHAGALKATWRSGYATVCKTVYPGSIPGVASNLRSRSEAKVARRSFSEGGPIKPPRATAGKPAQAKPRRTHRNFRRFAAFKAGPALLYALHARQLLFPGSSAVEQPAVNRLVAGSNPARGAKYFHHLDRDGLPPNPAGVRPGYVDCFNRFCGGNPTARKRTLDGLDQLIGSQHHGAQIGAKSQRPPSV
jgi:hypothetical protein